MESRAHAIAAGLFTLLLGVAVVLAAMWLSGDTYEKVYYVLESRYPVTGLFEQSGVRFRGVDVGKVTDIRFDHENPRVILIRVGVQTGTPITRGTYAEIRPQGVTGLSYIMLDDTGKNPEALPPSGARDTARIAVRPTLLETLFESSQDALADVREVAQRVSAVLSDENRERLGQALVGLQKASERIGNASDRIAAVANAAEPGVKSLAPLMADARRTLTQAETALGEITATSRALASRMEAVDRVAGSAEKATHSIGSLADTVASESLPRINLLVEELARTTRSLDRFVADLKEEPQSLVFGRKAGQPGPGERGFETRARQPAPEVPRVRQVAADEASVKER
ncbi:MAG TPA: MlaD family protein [Burkholderiales bacterium]|nr:MlaD family protein [Burkholderiales bacterium]